MYFIEVIYRSINDLDRCVNKVYISMGESL